MNFELYFSKILFSLYTEIKYEISLFYLKNYFTFLHVVETMKREASRLMEQYGG